MGTPTKAAPAPKAAPKAAAKAAPKAKAAAKATDTTADIAANVKALQAAGTKHLTQAAKGFGHESYTDLTDNQRRAAILAFWRGVGHTPLAIVGAVALGTNKSQAIDLYEIAMFNNSVIDAVLTGGAVNNYGLTSVSRARVAMGGALRKFRGDNAADTTPQGLLKRDSVPVPKSAAGIATLPRKLKGGAVNTAKALPYAAK